MKIIENLKRIGLDVAALITIALVMIFIPYDFLPIEAKANLTSLFFTKFILVSAGFIHAHITRKLAFNYITFSTEKEWSNNLLVIAIYVMFIFAWSRGG
jgi:hypothetical protein